MLSRELFYTIDEVVTPRRTAGIYNIAHLENSQDADDHKIAIALQHYHDRFAQAVQQQAYPRVTSPGSEYSIVWDSLWRQYAPLRGLPKEEFNFLAAYATFSISKCKESSEYLLGYFQRQFPLLDCSVIMADEGVTYFRNHYALLISRVAHGDLPDAAWIISPNNLVHYNRKSCTYEFSPTHNRFTDCFKAENASRAVSQLRRVEGGMNWRTVIPAALES
jgi:hypothetical protein